jgi:hypothetical protein
MRPRLDLREVEDVVDQAKKMGAASRDAREIGELVLVEGLPLVSA